MSQKKSRRDVKAADLKARAGRLEEYLKEKGVEEPVNFLEVLHMIRPEADPCLAGQISTIVSYGSKWLQEKVTAAAKVDWVI